VKFVVCIKNKLELPSREIAPTAFCTLTLTYDFDLQSRELG